MCGIAGIVEASAAPVDREQLRLMRDLMIARGPDGDGEYLEGSVGMTMRRLAVIDLERGGQPLFAAGGRVVAFQNGEIYNYRELRSLLEGRACRFQTDCDTEVLAHGFVEWGIDGLLERVDGMFALAILDRGARKLHLARDRMGEKPLFYTCVGGRFVYASSLLAIAALRDVPLEIDATSLERYLALHYVPGDRTIFRGLRRVLPGERLEVPIDRPQPRRVRYYRPPLGPTSDVGDNELAGILESAVESRLVSDVPVGVFLSGGVDSSLVAAIAASRVPRIKTFSIGFGSPAHDETRFAEQVAAHIGSDHRVFQFGIDSFNQLLPEVVGALDEPIGDQALLPVYWLAREARQVATVVLSGEGADEVFAGYGYYRRFLDERAPSVLFDDASATTPSGFPLLTDAATRRSLLEQPGRPDAWEADLLEWLARGNGGLQRATAADLASWLPDDLLVKLDRMTMAHGLEGRAPYLARSVVEAGLSLPAERRLTAKGVNKVALRAVAKRWLPDEIVNREKQGFVLPMGAWLHDWLQARGPLAKYFGNADALGLRADKLTALVVTDVAAGVRSERLVFALVALCEWHRSFVVRVRELRGRQSASLARRLVDSVHAVVRLATDLAASRPERASVLFVSGTPGDTQRYRCDHVIEHLQASGRSCRKIAHDDADLPHAMDSLVERHAVIVLHRVPLSPIIDRLLVLAKEAGCVLIFETDDLIFDDAFHRFHRRLVIDGPLRGDEVECYRATLARCDAATCTTEFLAGELGRVGKQAYLLANGFSAEMRRVSLRAIFSASSREDGRVVIGYASGTPSHAKDFAVALPALTTVLERYSNTELHILGFLDPDPSLARFGSRVVMRPFVPWRELPPLLRSFDINLAPLEMSEPFCQAKSEIKFIEAALVARPTIASPVGAYATAIRHGETGLLARGDGDWLAFMELLVGDPDRRRVMGEAAFAAVQERYSPERMAAPADALFSRIERTYAKPRAQPWMMRR